MVGELIDYGITTVVGNLGGEPCWVVSIEVTQKVCVVVCVELLDVELEVVIC